MKRWFIHYQTEPIIINWDSIKNDPESIDVVRDKANAYIEVMPVEDHERIVAELKEKLDVFKNREYGFENELELKQTIATQKRVIEKLREQRDIELEDNCWDDALTGGRPFEQARAMMDAEIEAIEKGL